jgi:hypothetical protein
MRLTARSDRVVHVKPDGGWLGGSLADAVRRPAPGTVIKLATGDYGALVLNAENADYVTLRAEDGAEPVFSRITIKGKGWRLEKISVIGNSAGAGGSKTPQSDRALVDISGASDVVIDQSRIATQLGVGFWVGREKPDAAQGPLLTGVQAANVNCLRVSGNVISNVFNGVTAGGDPARNFGFEIKILDNVIHDFGADGVDHFGSRIEIARNRIFNARNICDAKCVHPDGIQGWNYNNRPDIVNRDISIHDNVVISAVSPKSPMVWQNLQGITIFDGSWDNVRIENNLILVGTWHGLTLLGVKRAIVDHNTVLSTDPKFAAWVLVGQGKYDTRNDSLDTVVTNNVAGAVNIGKRAGQDARGVVLRDNKTGVSLSGYFKAWRPEAGQLDLQQKLSKDTARSRPGASLPPDLLAIP